MTSAPSSTTWPPEPAHLETFSARSGAPSLRVDGRALHSPYDPRKEADRFMAGQGSEDPPSTVLVMGEGLGHVTASARATWPDARVLTVFYSEEVCRLSDVTPASRWSPGAPQSLEDFLRRSLGELSVEGLKVVDWPASAQAFPVAARSAAEALRQVVHELNGSYTTTCAMGRLWLRNSLANFLGLATVSQGAPCPPGRPVLLAAPGPSLEHAAGLIAQQRDSLELWALPSSCPLLAEAGLVPDLVVMTDPGYYAMHHLQAARMTPRLAMPLSAARGVWSLARGADLPAPFLLGQPVFYERALLEAAGLRGPEVAPGGTVAATALTLALSATTGPVIVAGLDLCMRDLQSHARPNAFDTLLLQASTRRFPHEGAWYHRALLQGASGLPGSREAKVSPSLKVYAGWFETTRFPRKPFRLLPSKVALPGWQDLDAAAASELLARFTTRPGGRPPLETPLPARPARTAIIRRLLAGWRATLAAASPSFAWQEPSDNLGASATALSITFLLEPRGLVDAIRHRRHGHRDLAEGAAERALASATAFLGGLERRVPADA